MIYKHSIPAKLIPVSFNHWDTVLSVSKLETELIKRGKGEVLNLKVSI